MIYYKVIKYELTDDDRLVRRATAEINIANNDPLNAREGAFQVWRTWMENVSSLPQPFECEVWIKEESHSGEPKMKACVVGFDYDKVAMGLAMEAYLLGTNYDNIPLQKVNRIIDTKVQLMLLFGERYERSSLTEFPDIVDLDTELTICSLPSRIEENWRKRKTFLGLDDNPLNNLPF